MPIRYQKWITRDDLRDNPHQVYVFGDNVLREGYGGQAKSMRGEPNAIGVVTKFRPDMGEGAFFENTLDCLSMIKLDLAKVLMALKEGRWVIVPADGIGTGLSELPTRAPFLDEYIKQFWRDMEHEF